MKVGNLVGFWLGLWLGLDGTARARPLPPPPETPRRPVVDEYPGARVTDDYRWLERGDDPEVERWSAAQDARARAWLDQVPSAGRIRARVGQLLGAPSPDYRALRFRGGRLFALKLQPPSQQPLLVTLAASADPATERVVLDPNQLDRGGAMAIDFYEPSLDGRRVAVSLSRGGGERGDLHVYDVATGRPLADPIPRVHGGTAGGSVAWNEDGSGFHYTRYPRDGERPPGETDLYQQVWFRRLGAAGDDRYAIGKEFPRTAEIALASSEDGRYLLASVARGDGGERAHFLRIAHEGQGSWSQVARFTDQVVDARFGPDGSLYLLSRADAPRGRILRLPPGGANLRSAAVVVDEGPHAIERFLPASNRIYVVELDGGPSLLRVYDQGGREQKPVEILPLSSVPELVRLENDEILLRNESFLQPPAWYRYAPRIGRTLPTPLRRASLADLGDIEVVREFATSRDGTRIPMSVLRPMGIRLRRGNPTILTGHGGFGVSFSPRYSDGFGVWLEQGGVIAVANLRGGGELGEEWRRAGHLTRKQNVWDDFLACARYLVDTGYTRPEKLAIEGAGGPLVGAALTQRPDLFRAVVARGGPFDMLRLERSPGGSFSVGEYGSVGDPEQLRALRAWSPYHRVADRTPYPAALLLVGASDPRVDPAHARKMVARLQAASTSKAPVLLRTSAGSGNGRGAPLAERIGLEADVWTFLFDRLGVPFRPVAGARR